MKLTERGLVSVASSALKVGDIVVIEKGMRAPADVVLLRTTDTSGASFIR
jgi:phospholipid-translocating ATPase